MKNTIESQTIRWYLEVSNQEYDGRTTELLFEMNEEEIEV